jgi:hypothetical protein
MRAAPPEQVEPQQQDGQVMLKKRKRGERLKANAPSYLANPKPDQLLGRIMFESDFRTISTGWYVHWPAIYRQVARGKTNRPSPCNV